MLESGRYSGTDRSVDAHHPLRRNSMSKAVQQLADNGVSIWLDDISRKRLSSGGLQSLIDDSGIVGVTSNPTIFAKAFSEADDYAVQLGDLRTRGVDLEEAVRALATYDIRWAADVLRPVYGRVSIEVDPRLAHDTRATVAEARALWWLVDRPNTMIKIPAMLEGIPAITETIGEGISVNVTLIFGLDRYDEVMDAYMTGLEKAKENGHDLATIESVASFFVSRVDTEVDKRLDDIGTDEAKNMRSKAAIANARLAYERYEKVIASERWQALEQAGAHRQRPLWASTSVKDPDLPDTLYVTELVAPQTVNTTPEATIEAIADHGEIRGDTVTTNYDDAHEVLDTLARLGVEYDDVIATLEREGVEKFEKSWQELQETVRGQLEDESQQA
jgi:transaldolase